jgi:uncharacterized protein YgbK (DUF1537 family)
MTAVPPLLTFYGDDFTGSSAVLEILALAGLRTVLFLDAPDAALLAKLGDIRAVGIAGVARSRSPAWMDAELPRCFAALKALGAPILHYKTCSTFDSAPHLGSIGRATEIGLAVTGADFAPLIVGAPAIGRYQVFGTLFAALDGVIHRLDRHPVMARHPATPMNEADLCRHLDAQTPLPKAVLDGRALLSALVDDELVAARARGARIIAIDAYDDATLSAAGRLVWQAAAAEPAFAVGSQGVEYALTAWWRQCGLLPETPPPPVLKPAEPVLVVSGSCSEITARQIAAAQAGGFLIVRVDASKAIAASGWAGEIAQASAAVEAGLAEGRNVLACTARGPEDSAIAAFSAALVKCRVDAGAVHARIGDGLGRIARAARLRLGVRRIVFSGGDTSGHAMLAVGAEALEFLAPLADGVPLLRVRSPDAAFDGLEIALKGGQMGDSTLFLRAATGRAP